MDQVAVSSVLPGKSVLNLSFQPAGALGVFAVHAAAAVGVAAIAAVGAVGAEPQAVTTVAAAIPRSAATAARVLRTVSQATAAARGMTAPRYGMAAYRPGG